MNVNAIEVNNTAVKELTSLLINEKGEIIPVPASKLRQFSQNDISGFCHKYAIYQLPTIELIEWLQEETKNDNVIEIGSGNGCIGRNIPALMFDNFMQEDPVVKEYYHALRQPTIIYGHDVIKMDANKAVDSFKPSTVIGCWVTQKWYPGCADGNVLGVNEMDFKGKIKRYIVIGNEIVHGRKKILENITYKTFKPDWLFSRSIHADKNIIYDFNFQ